MKIKTRRLIFLIALIVILCTVFIYLINSGPITFHVLIATAGRPSLRKLLDSLRDELEEGDAITIVFDGDEAKEKSGISPDWLEGHKSHINIQEQVPNLGFWGHGIRNKYQGILNPQCTFVMHADDDDVYIAGSFAKLRKLCTNPNYLYFSKIEFIFKNNREPRRTVPGSNSIVLGDIGTPNGIIPYRIAAKGEWGHFYGGDFHYYDTLKEHAYKLVFLEEVIYTVIKE